MQKTITNENSTKYTLYILFIGKIQQSEFMKAKMGDCVNAESYDYDSCTSVH